MTSENPRKQSALPAIILTAGTVVAITILAAAVARSTPPPIPRTYIDAPTLVVPDGR